jgi:hypothetical protein
VSHWGEGIIDTAISQGQFEMKSRSTYFLKFYHGKALTLNVDKMLHLAFIA